MKYIAALYMRLSKDDEQTGRSGIDSQRLLLREYAEKENFEIYDEYVDDGYSGTSYNRPAFKRMIEDIERGNVNSVIVKDMSRLGRDYISTGNLTEVYFPDKFVRLIAINDGYDSDRGYDDMAPFRHVMNEMYARDISRKIRSALYAKMRSGQYIGSFAPYGYKKNDTNKNLLVPDENAARVVTLIFELRSRGISTKDIAERLNEKNIPVPLDYRNKSKSGKMRLWTQSGICKILRNQVYIGHTVQGKSRKASIKALKSRSIKREEWIIVKNTHEPIVSEEVFYKVNKKT